MENTQQWKSLSAVVKTESGRYIKTAGKEETETRYYITGSSASAKVTGKAVRSHRGIENQLHRQPDVSFSEGKFRKRESYAAQNFSLLNRTALNFKHEQSKKRSVRGKRLVAGWNNEYLLKILHN